jgi:hypothetical protein
LPAEIRETLLESAERSVSAEATCDAPLGRIKPRATRLGSTLDLDGTERFRERWTFDICLKQFVFVVSWHLESGGALRHSIAPETAVVDEPTTAQSQAPLNEVEMALAAIGQDVRDRWGCAVVRIAGRNITTLRGLVVDRAGVFHERWTVDACSSRHIYFVQFGAKGKFLAVALDRLPE